MFPFLHNGHFSSFHNKYTLKYVYFGKECKSSFLRLDIECGHEEKIICHILMYSGVVGSIRKGKNKILKKMCAM